MPHTLIGQVSYISYLAICAIVLWRGGTAERITAALFAAICLATPLIQDHVRYDDPRELIYLTNLPQLVWLIFIALRIGKPWMLAAAAFEILATATEIGHDFVRQIVGAYVYISLLIAWSWGGYLSLLWGGLTARREERLAQKP